MNGARRVVIFCLLTAVLPTILIIIPLYLRNNVFSDVSYEVSESDVLEIEDISTVFCQSHTIRMNYSFNAYQLDSQPEVSKTRKHQRHKKSMRLPDDVMEYWGFFLPKDSYINLSVCSRYNGSRVMLVRGDRALNTCNLTNRLKNELQNKLVPEQLYLPTATIRQARSTGLDEKNDAAEDTDDDGLETFQIGSGFTKQKIGSIQRLLTMEGKLLDSKLRHARSKSFNKTSEFKDNVRWRPKRNVEQLNNEKVLHGGNADKPAENDSDDSSASSYENELFACFEGKMLEKWTFPPTDSCNSTYFDNSSVREKKTNVFNQGGYYYYIFYSDNDLVDNEVHALFDIHKPTYILSNVTNKCINDTTCSFPVGFLSNDIVIVEIPSNEDLKKDEESLSSVISVCEPRMSVYIIFPILVLILILGCAFL